MTKTITKLALVGALLVSTLSAASAQTFKRWQDNQPAYSQEAPKDHATDLGAF